MSSKLFILPILIKAMIIETNLGNITIELDRAAAPATCENFERYVKEKFYDGTVFHRVIDGFMIQGGGFLPNGKQKETHEPIILEARKSNLRGTIAMARTSIPDSATSQFFINVADNKFLDPAQGNDGYAAFGQVTSGMEVVDAISHSSTGTKFGMQDWPDEDVVIISIRV